MTKITFLLLKECPFLLFTEMRTFQIFPIQEMFKIILLYCWTSQLKVNLRHELKIENSRYSTHFKFTFLEMSFIIIRSSKLWNETFLHTAVISIHQNLPFLISYVKSVCHSTLLSWGSLIWSSSYNCGPLGFSVDGTRCLIGLIHV